TVTDTRTTVGGLGDGRDVTVTVRAVNEAGAGAAATGTARTVAAPRVTVTGSSADAPSVPGAVTVGAGGRRATCAAATGGRAGTRLKAYCRRQGEEVYADLYNHDKRSTWWVQVDYAGRNWIPWAWLNLDGGDAIAVLPTC